MGAWGGLSGAKFFSFGGVVGESRFDFGGVVGERGENFFWFDSIGLRAKSLCGFPLIPATSLQ